MSRIQAKLASALLVLPILQSHLAHAARPNERPSEQPAAPSPVVPQLFAPGIVSGPANDGSPTFSPDGNTLLFTRSTANWGAILESHRTNGQWSKPALASFSGDWSNFAPEMSPDGSFLLFVALRPVDSPAAAANPKANHPVANLWRVDRKGTNWSEPARLPDEINIGHSIWKPSIAANGTIYFVAIDDKGAKRLYSSRFENGAYSKAQPLEFSSGSTGDVDPEVAPDESFLLFASDGRLPGDQKDHLFIVARKQNGWGPAVAIRFEGDDRFGYSTDNEPHLSPDKTTVYFSSDRPVPVEFPRTHEQAQRDVERLEEWDNSNANVWSIPLAPYLKQAVSAAQGAS
jgi:Tol biopolymer transport system component